MMKVNNDGDEDNNIMFKHCNDKDDNKDEDHDGDGDGDGNNNEDPDTVDQNSSRGMPL